MSLPQPVAEAAQAYAADQAALTEAAAQINDGIARTRLNADPTQWRDAVADTAEQLLALQQAAVEQTEPYLTAALEAQGADTAADGTINTAAFVDRTDGGGSWLRNLIYAPPSAYRDAVAAGKGDTLARLAAQFVANSVVVSAMQDIPRSAVTTGMWARSSVTGYVRVLRGVSCARCAILAGRRYRKSAFARHPRCDCGMAPFVEGADDWTTSPKGYFRSLTAEQQDAVFGEAGAEAIRLGADMAQVVNADKGVTTVGGTRITTEGTTARGIAGQRLQGQARLMPDEIFLLAEQEGWSREQTLAGLYRYAYLT